MVVVNDSRRLPGFIGQLVPQGGMGSIGSNDEIEFTVFLDSIFGFQQQGCFFFNGDAAGPVATDLPPGFYLGAGLLTGIIKQLEQATPVTEALGLEKTRQFSRIPVFDDSVDQITGHVLRSDLYEAERTGRGAEALQSLARDVIHVSEKLPVYKLIDLFIKHRMHLFVVQDEFGQTSGVVTLEDALETLLGEEIVDESDTVADMQELARQKSRRRMRDGR